MRPLTRRAIQGLLPGPTARRYTETTGGGKTALRDNYDPEHHPE